ncbi:MAG: SURF1 family protein [Pseudomonadota bacterium]
MARRVVAVLWVAAILGLVALGTWQVQRLAWKRSLIAQVEARLAAVPVPAPAGAGSGDAYRRVVATGRFIGADSFVQASTVRGPGWWVMTPLHTPSATILVNRGYVPNRFAPPPPRGQVTVTGLLRLTEPGGGFLRSNDPAADRWYSRDVAAIAAKRGLAGVAPYFIDADATVGEPVGGLTVVRFPNNHLPYAITWYILALMATAGLLYWRRTAR